jgi:hypothetical protein
MCQFHEQHCTRLETHVKESDTQEHIENTMPHKASIEQNFDFHADALEAHDITRGVCRLFTQMGYAPLTEFPLSNNRRVDVAGLAKDGAWMIAEVKASERDFRTDNKWQEYLPYCETYYFAVAGGFPMDILPDGVGIIVADAFHGAILRKSPEAKMNGNRRRTQLLRFGNLAARRLQDHNDPGR